MVIKTSRWVKVLSQKVSPHDSIRANRHVLALFFCVIQYTYIFQCPVCVEAAHIGEHVTWKGPRNLASGTPHLYLDSYREHHTHGDY